MENNEVIIDNLSVNEKVQLLNELRAEADDPIIDVERPSPDEAQVTFKSTDYVPQSDALGRHMLNNHQRTILAESIIVDLVTRLNAESESLKKAEALIQFWMREVQKLKKTR